MKKLLFVFGVILGLYGLFQLATSPVTGSEAYQTGQSGGHIFLILFGLVCAHRLWKSE